MFIIIVVTIRVLLVINSIRIIIGIAVHALVRDVLRLSQVLLLGDQSRKISFQTIHPNPGDCP